MKKALSFIMFLILSGTILVAQSDQKSQEILNAVKKNTSALHSYKVKFNYKIENLNDKTSSEQSGTLYIKDKKYKIILQGQQIISNGDTIWNYMPDAEEVQVNNVDPNNTDLITPNSILNIWEKDFKHRFVKEVVENDVVLEVIHLLPDKGKSYYKIDLYINKSTKYLQKAVVHEREGIDHTYEILEMDTKVELKDSEFVFDTKKHPDVEVIDLRE